MMTTTGRLLTSAMELLKESTTILKSKPLMNLLRRVRAVELLNRPIAGISRQPSSWTRRRGGRADHSTSSSWYNKLAAYYRSHFETVPYTNRTRFILYSPVFECRIISYLVFGKTKYRRDVHPPTHPYYFRLHRISRRILQAACRTTPIPDLDWEVLVGTDENFKFNGLCMPGGKIIIDEHWFQDLTITDADIAFLIGHEVAHAIARHSAENVTKWLLFLLPDIMILLHSPWLGFLSGILSTLYLLSPCDLERDEMEADYIGFMLYASAGYDPRKVKKVQKVFKILRTSPEKRKDTFSTLIKDYFSYHPSYEKSSQLISQSMKEALALYRESIYAGDGLKKKAVDVNISSNIY